MTEWTEDIDRNVKNNNQASAGQEFVVDEFFGRGQASKQTFHALFESFDGGKSNDFNILKPFLHNKCNVHREHNHYAGLYIFLLI